MPIPPLLILGASGRAAASSARRSGFDPTVVDLFADRDLAALSPAHRVDPGAYPDALPALAAGLPDSPWIYTGALENRPDLVDRIAADRPLLGVSGTPLRDCRSPARWASILRSRRVIVPDHRSESDPPPTSGDWLVKPLKSSSGHAIRPWRRGEGPIPPGHYLQTRLRGPTLGATFVGDGRSARLAGVCRTFLGPNSAGLPVAYRGSVGPHAIGPAATEVLVKIGHAIASGLGVRGLFGVDLILVRGLPIPVEINPRYTASVEVIERALGLSLVAEHAHVFGIDVDPAPRPPTGTAGKLILFARRPATAPIAWPWTDPADPDPTVADLPGPGTPIAPGDPVMTVLARGRSSREVASRLAARAMLWRRRIDRWPITR